MPSLNLARMASPVAALLVALALAPAGCEGGLNYSGIPEGDRCNPYDSHNDCSSGLQCTVSQWQFANQGTISYQGTPTPFLATGAGIDNNGNFNILQFCPENYCCPVDSTGALTTSGNPNCQPGCNGGAQSICTSLGNTASPYIGVCDFAMNGTQPAEGGTEAASPAPEAGPEASTPSEGGGG